MSNDDIIKAIDEHLTKNPRQYYKDFYIGITDNVENCLFGYHKVNKQTDWWIYCQSDNEDIARQIEKHYIDKGMKGAGGGGKREGKALYIYCYEITNETKE